MTTLGRNFRDLRQRQVVIRTAVIQSMMAAITPMMMPVTKPPDKGSEVPAW